MSSAPNPGLIASQWNDEFHALLSARRPDLQVLSVPQGAALGPLPEQARVLLAQPFPKADRTSPAPQGWPWGLKWIQLVSVGIDFYPPWLLHTPGVQVSTAHGSSSDTIAHFALASILRVQLRLEERRATQASDWHFTSSPGVAGATVGVLGFGGIGHALAAQALALGFGVLALRRSGAPLDLPGVQRAAHLDELLAGSDHLVLAAPGTPQTRHLINADTLAHARQGLHLVNVARGSLIDQEALRAALDSGRVGWASLDVTEPEPLPEGHWLYQHPRVWLTPHTSAISPQVRRGVVDKLLRNLDALDRGEAPEDLVAQDRGY